MKPQDSSLRSSKKERAKWDAYYASLEVTNEDSQIQQFGLEFSSIVSTLLPQGSKILEVGCGAGYQSLALARTGKFDISLLDFSSEAIKYARKLFERENLNAEFISGDVFDSGKAEFHLVFNAGALEHYSFEDQIAFLKGMASRSKKYVIASVPNRLCYWYWLWRIHESSRGNWPWGKEVPLVNLSGAFQGAGVHFLGQQFMGDSWTEDFIKGIGINRALLRKILEVHRSPIIPKHQKCYLVTVLGSIVPKIENVPPNWHKSPLEEDMEIAEMKAVYADTLALKMKMESELKRLRQRLLCKETGILRRAFGIWRSEGLNGLLLRILTKVKYRIEGIRVVHRAFEIWRSEGFYKLLVKVSRKVVNKLINKASVVTHHYSHSKKLEQILNSKAATAKGILIYPPTVDWNIALFQRPHQLAIQLSKLGYLFLYCTNNDINDNFYGFEKLANNLYITNMYKLLIRKLSDAWIILSPTYSAISYQGIKKYRDQGFRILYDYADEISPLIFQKSVEDMQQRHKLLDVKDVDLVITSATRLYDEMVQRFPESKVLLLPNAVEYEHFKIERHEHEMPAEIEEIVAEGKPVIGYYGALAKWIDYDLLNYMAEHRPDWNLVVIGTDYDSSIKALAVTDNIRYLGSVDYSKLPKYAIWFNVAIIPFREGDVAKSASPIKLYEYMAMNKPVVVTKDLIECHKYDGVFVAEDKDDFIEKVEKALILRNDPHYIRLLDKQAKENTWGKRAREIDKYVMNYTAQ